jgi:hypothetical protein
MSRLYERLAEARVMTLEADVTTTDGQIVHVVTRRSDCASDTLFREAFQRECEYWHTHPLYPAE